MPFPTQSFSPVLTPTDSTGDTSVTITVPSTCKTLLGLFSTPGGPWFGAGPNAVTWDAAGVNEALTQQGTPQPATSSGSTWWGQGSIWVKQTPTAAAAKLLLFDMIPGGGGSDQIGGCAWGIDEAVTLVSNGGASFTIAGAGQQDWTITGIATQAGDVIVSVLSDDAGSGGAPTAPTILGGTSLGAVGTGAGDSWNCFGYLVATGTSTDLTWRYPSNNAGGWGTGAVKYVVLRDATPVGGGLAWIKA